MAPFPLVRRQHGFTLIELLVVILIIGILVAVSAPSFLGQASKAQDSVAKQNLAITYHTAAPARVDNDGHYPVYGSDPRFSFTPLLDELSTGQPQQQYLAVPDYRGVLGLPPEYIGVDTSAGSSQEIVAYSQSASGTVFCLSAGDSYQAQPVAGPNYTGFAQDASATSCGAGTTVNTSTFPLSVARVGGGGGTIASSGGTPSDGPIDCGSACNATYQSGDAVTLTATPDSTSAFLGWGGDCSGTSTCTLTMDTLRGAVAFFGVQGGGGSGPSALAVHFLGSGSGHVLSAPAGLDCAADCTATFDPSATVVLTAAADVGSSFLGWSGDCYGSGATCTLAMGVDHAAGAYFAPSGGPASPLLFVSLTSGFMGHVDSSPSGIDCSADCVKSYTSGTKVTLVAQPIAGAVFQGWSGDCASTSTDVCTVTMTESRHVAANFWPADDSGVGGSGSGSGGGSGGLDGWGGGCCAFRAADFGIYTSYVLPIEPPTTGKGIVTVSLANQRFSCIIDGIPTIESKTDGCAWMLVWPVTESPPTVKMSEKPARGSSFVKWTDDFADCGSASDCSSSFLQSGNLILGGVMFKIGCPVDQQIIQGVCRSGSGASAGSGSGSGSGGGNPDCTSTPANDNLACASDLAVEPSNYGVATVSTAGSTVEPGEPDYQWTNRFQYWESNPGETNYQAKHSVWFKFTPSSSGDVELTTFGSTDPSLSPPYDDFYPQLDVYTGPSAATSFADLQQAHLSDSSDAADWDSSYFYRDDTALGGSYEQYHDVSQVPAAHSFFSSYGQWPTLHVSAGQTYYVQVEDANSNGDPQGGQTGNLHLTWGYYQVDASRYPQGAPGCTGCLITSNPSGIRVGYDPQGSDYQSQNPFAGTYYFHSGVTLNLTMNDVRSAPDPNDTLLFEGMSSASYFDPSGNTSGEPYEVGLSNCSAKGTTVSASCTLDDLNGDTAILAHVINKFAITAAFGDDGGFPGADCTEQDVLMFNRLDCGMIGTVDDANWPSHPALASAGSCNQFTGSDYYHDPFGNWQTNQPTFPYIVYNCPLADGDRIMIQQRNVRQTDPVNGGYTITRAGVYLVNGTTGAKTALYLFAQDPSFAYDDLDRYFWEYNSYAASDPTDFPNGPYPAPQDEAYNEGYFTFRWYPADEKLLLLSTAAPWSLANPDPILRVITAGGVAKTVHLDGFVLTGSVPDIGLGQDGSVLVAGLTGSSGRPGLFQSP